MERTPKLYHPIKAWCLETGTLTGDLAKAVGWSPVSLSQCISDDLDKRRQVPIRWRDPLARAMGVSVGEILGPDRALCAVSPLTPKE